MILDFIFMDLHSLQARRLSNLDASIAYFSKRVATYRKQREKFEAASKDLPDGSPESRVNLDSLLVLDGQIRILDDVISYLKLC